MKIGDIVEITKDTIGFPDEKGSKAIITNISGERYSLYLYEKDSRRSWFTQSDLKMIKEIEYI